MSMDFKLEGIPEWNRAMTELVARTHTATTAAVREGAHVVQAAMMRRAGEGGRHAKGTPTPAVPGGGPAVITGTFRRGFRVGPVISTAFSASVLVGPTGIQSRRLELEYNYPSAGPGLRDALPQLGAIYTRAWRTAVK